MSALVLFVAQVVAAVLAVQLVHSGFVAAAPLHAQGVARFGPQVAAAGLSLAVVVIGHTAGVLLTIPALVGVQVWKIQVKRVATLRQVMTSAPLILLNFLLSFVVGSGATILTTDKAVLIDMSVGLPSRQTLAWQTGFCLLMTEVWFYHVHRLFHENKKLYALVHKIHHQWQAPVAIVGSYAHPVEHIGCNLFSILWGPFLCGAHPTTALAYTLVFGIGAYGHHSGYWTDDMGMHDFHHEAFNVNYGNAHILDHFYGTYRTKSTASAASAGKAQ